MHQVLLGSEIQFGGLSRRVAQKQLDLFKLAAGGAAQLRAATPPNHEERFQLVLQLPHRRSYLSPEIVSGGLDGPESFIFGPR
jgi:hypothetical protein